MQNVPNELESAEKGRWALNLMEAESHFLIYRLCILSNAQQQQHQQQQHVGFEALTI